MAGLLHRYNNKFRVLHGQMQPDAAGCHCVTCKVFDVDLQIPVWAAAGNGTPLCSAARAAKMSSRLCSRSSMSCTPKCAGRCLCAAWTLHFSEGCLFVCMQAELHRTTADNPSACSPACTAGTTQVYSLRSAVPSPRAEPAVQAPHRCSLPGDECWTPIGRCCCEPSCPVCTAEDTIAVACQGETDACLMHHK